MKLSISLLNSRDRISDILKLNKLNFEYFHIDVMDGKFVSQKEYSYEEIERISKISRKALDIHLMVDNPEIYIEKIKNLPNIHNITIHLEINKDIKNILLKVKKSGIKCGLSIKPNTDINLLKSYLDIVDLILVMTVEPGFGGQQFLSSSRDRLLEIKEMTKHHNILLEVDGGINNKTIKEVSSADAAVVGSYITTSDNMEDSIHSLFV